VWHNHDTHRRGAGSILCLGDHLFNKILAVDEHAWFRRLLIELLLFKFPDTQILEADNAALAMLLAEHHLPDVMIIDRNLSGIDALDVTRWFKQHFSHLPIILLALDDDDVDHQEASQAGVDHFVNKKYVIIELIPALEEILAKKMAGPSAR
jgi:DNA-binding NarL/FixJ family response regulator